MFVADFPPLRQAGGTLCAILSKILSIKDFSNETTNISFLSNISNYDFWTIEF